MVQILLGIFLLLHGLVHLLYSGQSARLFKLQPGMIWPDGSWSLSRIFGDEPTRVLASILCALVTAGFLAGGIGLFASQSWWRPVVVASAVFSAMIFILLWDGKFQMLLNNGIFAILINIAILVALLVFRWPRLGF
ncbi:MAG: hypothetical protein A2144_07065 [Chloroflexi bacterium RBG_16_50_9]|nr:MAG: hypothetical protein A2144_07065 [Chloroflexi bacterium RBG_16_50_9]